MADQWENLAEVADGDADSVVVSINQDSVGVVTASARDAYVSMWLTPLSAQVLIDGLQEYVHRQPPQEPKDSR